jgi:hypothetical protein
MKSSPKRPHNGNGSGRQNRESAAPKIVEKGDDSHVTTLTLVSPLPNVTVEDLLTRLGNLGLIDEEIASVFGLSHHQFSDVLFFNPALHDLLNDAKEVPNRKVESALYKRALGYKIREVHKVEGRPVKVVEKEIAPDVVADIFWLKNRDPKRWRDVMEVSHSLRDRMDRAHQALRLGGGSGPLSLPSSDKEDENEELES